MCTKLTSKPIRESRLQKRAFGNCGLEAGVPFPVFKVQFV
jgi:hypothetical protein